MLKNSVFSLVYFSLVSVFVGCAQLSSTVSLNPTISSGIPKVTGSPPLFLSVQGTRKQKTFGIVPQRGNKKAENVSAQVPLENVVRLQLSESLTQAGFIIAARANEDIPTLSVDINKLQYDLVAGAASTQINVVGEIRAVAKNGLKSNSKTFKVENGKKWGFSPPAKGHELFLNDALSEMLEALVTDEKLLKFLAQTDFGS